MSIIILGVSAANDSEINDVQWAHVPAVMESVQFLLKNLIWDSMGPSVHFLKGCPLIVLP